MKYLKHWKKVLATVLIFPVLLWFLVAWTLSTTEIVKVTGKENRIVDVVMVEKRDAKSGKIIQVPKNVDRYMVYTDKGAFEYHETWLYLTWDVADQFGRLQEGKVYKFKHYGVRSQFFDWYENIIDFEEIKDDSGS